MFLRFVASWGAPPRGCPGGVTTTATRAASSRPEVGDVVAGDAVGVRLREPPAIQPMFSVTNEARPQVDCSWCGLAR